MRSLAETWECRSAVREIWDSYTAQAHFGLDPSGTSLYDANQRVFGV